MTESNRLVKTAMVTIVGTDEESGLTMAVDRMGNEFEVDTRIRTGGTARPRPDERWLLERQGKGWLVKVRLDNPAPKKFQMDRTNVTSVAGALIDALAEIGLIEDSTETGGDVLMTNVFNMVWPIGSTRPWQPPVMPARGTWLAQTGQSLSSTTYSALRAALGNPGDSTSFSLPTNAFIIRAL